MIAISGTKENVTMLEDSLNATIYFWDELEWYAQPESFKIEFGVIVSDELKNNRSVVAKTVLLTKSDLCKHK